MAIFDPEKGRLRTGEIFSFLLKSPFYLQKTKNRASKRLFSVLYSSNSNLLSWPDPPVFAGCLPKNAGSGVGLYMMLQFGHFD
jgi:hypothetical protein